MVTSAVVRLPVVEDAPAIARVHVDAWRETYTGHVPDALWNQDAYERRVALWTHLLGPDGPSGIRVVAERSGTIVGFASAGPSSSDDACNGHAPSRDHALYALYLLAREHGSGLGQKLLDAVIGTQAAQLWVMRGNDRAIAFYRRNGFQPDGVEVTDERLGVVEIRMVR
jgi:GNAT superfamily N-acetyltransferase